MSYYIDLETISLDQYCEKLINAYLVPSRAILRDRTEERFNYFRTLGIQNAAQLLNLLKNKKKFAELQQESLFSGDYLKILLRELGSLHTKPNKLSEFTSITENTINKLGRFGIKHTEHLFYRVLTPKDRQELARETEIDVAEIVHLCKLSDLSRIRWVGANFAQMLYAVGIDTVEKVAQSNPEDLHQKINAHNKEQGMYKGHIGLNDMKLLVSIAKEISLDIQY